jgi:peptidoglycan hydrolase FlgJ
MMKMAFDPHIIRPILNTSKDNFSSGNDQNDLKKVCEDFEAIFINTMFQEMRKSIPNQGYLEHEIGMDIFQEMMDMEIAGEMSRRGGIGLSRLLYEQLRNEQDPGKK